MKTPNTNLGSFVGLLVATAIMAGCATTPKGPLTLKSAYKKDFYIGVAVNRDIVTGTNLRADNVNRNMAQLEKDTALAETQFNQIVPENDLKWALIQPNPGPQGFDFRFADAYVDWGIKHHMYIVGHTLVWHSQTPNWVFAASNSPAGRTPATVGGASAAGPNNGLSEATTNTTAATTNAPARGRRGRGFGGGFGGGGFSGPRATRDQLLARLKEHIQTEVGRYKGKVKVWDVVNEALADGGTNLLRNSPWLQIIGPDFIAKAFEYAHEADPKAILRYNDYSLENPAKRKKLITLIKSLQAQHVPVMAIGSQTHVSVSSPSFEQEDKTLTDLETLGLPIHITEFDVNGARGGQRTTAGDVASNASTTQGGLVSDADKKLAKAYSGLFRAFIKHKKSVKLVTFWGINDGVSWRAAGRPLLFDANDQPKPAFGAVIDAAQGKFIMGTTTNAPTATSR